MEINKKYIKKDILNDAIVVSTEDNDDVLYKMNETAILVWNGIENNESIDEISNNILKKYNADYNKVYTDVKNTITEFKKHGFIIE